MVAAVVAAEPTASPDGHQAQGATPAVAGGGRSTAVVAEVVEAAAGHTADTVALGSLGVEGISGALEPTARVVPMVGSVAER